MQQRSLHWRHNGHDSVSNHQPHDCLLNRLFIRAQIKKNITAPCHWPFFVEFIGDRWIPAQGASNAENVSIWWRHHGIDELWFGVLKFCVWQSLIVERASFMVCIQLHNALGPFSFVSTSVSTKTGENPRFHTQKQVFSTQNRALD